MQLDLGQLIAQRFIAHGCEQSLIERVGVIILMVLHEFTMRTGFSGYVDYRPVADAERVFVGNSEADLER